MSIIKCPECGEQVSDKAQACIHCGYPLNNSDENNANSNYCLVLCNTGKNKASCIGIIRTYLNLGLKQAKELCETGKEEVLFTDTNRENLERIKNEFFNNGSTVRIDTTDMDNMILYNQENRYDKPITCPRCGSTSVTTGQRGFSLLTGFWGSNKTVNRCGKCGYSWKP